MRRLSNDVDGRPRRAAGAVDLGEKEMGAGGEADGAAEAESFGDTIRSLREGTLNRLASEIRERLFAGAQIEVGQPTGRNGGTQGKRSLRSFLQSIS